MSDGPMLLADARRLEKGKDWYESEIVEAHARVGARGLSVDIHADGDDEVYAAFISWEGLEQLIDASADYIPSDLPAPKNSAGDLLN